MRRKPRKAWSRNANRKKATIRVEQAKAKSENLENEIRAGVIRSVLALDKIENMRDGEMIRVRDIERLAERTKKGEE